MNMYTDRQIALQCATEYCIKRLEQGFQTDSDAVLRVANKYQKFLADGVVEAPHDYDPRTVGVNGAAAIATTTGGWKPRIGNG